MKSACHFSNCGHDGVRLAYLNLVPTVTLILIVETWIRNEFRFVSKTTIIEFLSPISPLWSMQVLFELRLWSAVATHQYIMGLSSCCWKLTDIVIFQWYSSIVGSPQTFANLKNTMCIAFGIKNFFPNLIMNIKLHIEWELAATAAPFCRLS